MQRSSYFCAVADGGMWMGGVAELVGGGTELHLRLLGLCAPSLLLLTLTLTLRLDPLHSLLLPLRGTPSLLCCSPTVTR